MEELSERSELRKLQKEQERERRRLRDRQRRQSMSLEEREKHLARRRRNYQLRRQRAENARVDHQFVQTGITTGGEMLTSNQHQTVTSDTDLTVQCNDVARVGSVQGQEILNAEHSKSEGEGLEVPAHKLAKFPGRLRLNHIKHLARSFNDPVGELIGDNHRIAADVMIKGNGTSNCISPKGMRLNRVKRLARALNSAVEETTGPNLHSETEGQQC